MHSGRSPYLGIWTYFWYKLRIWEYL